MNRQELNKLINDTTGSTLRIRTITIAETYAASVNKELKEHIKLLENKISLLKEDIESIHLFLDDNNFPKENESGARYSIVGRIKNKKI